MNLSSDLKDFCKFLAFTLKFQKFIFQSLEHFFLTVGQNNFGNKIPFLNVSAARKKFAACALQYFCGVSANILKMIANECTAIFLKKK